MKHLSGTSSLTTRKNLPDSSVLPIRHHAFTSTVFVLILILITVSTGGCNSVDEHEDVTSNTSGESASKVRDQIDGKWLITRSDRDYSVEDFLAIGWKKSKQLEIEALPNSIDAWYGFYMQKDIELRFYDSHEAAIEHGVPPAQETIKKDAGARIGAATVWTVNIALYGAYAVAGNVVMMCELELASCEALIDALETTESNES